MDALGGWGAIVASVLAAVLAACLTALSIVYAHKRQLLDAPGRRRSHALPTPRGGGVGPVVAIVMCALLPATVSGGGGVTFALASIALLMVAAIGWIDDHRSLGIRIRLGVHAVAATLVVAASVASATSFTAELDDLFALALPIVVVIAIIWSINLHNFMDGINGLLACQVVFVLAASALIMQADLSSTPVKALVLVISAVAVLAFVPFNFPRARVFMGDVGSGALGLLVALAVLWQFERSVLGLATGIVLCSAFVTDATATLLLRMVRGRRWYSAHREHLYQWLVRSGRSHAQVVMLYMGWNILVALPVAWVMNHRIGLGVNQDSARWTSPAGDAWIYVAALYGAAWVVWVAVRRTCVQSVRRRAGK